MIFLEGTSIGVVSLTNSAHGLPVEDEVQIQWLGILDLQWPGLGSPHQHP